MMMLFNLPAYALRLPFAASATADDGRLDVRLFDRGSTFHTVRYLINVAFHRHESLPDVQVATASRVRLECDIPVPIELDGDPGGTTPAEFRVLPAAQEIVVPEDFQF
jgi:diacylglycerol kinase family enzyme